jgi:hypothetical protein
MENPAWHGLPPPLAGVARAAPRPQFAVEIQ